MSEERAWVLLENFRGRGLVHYLYFIITKMRNDVEDLAVCALICFQAHAITCRAQQLMVQVPPSN